MRAINLLPKDDARRGRPQRPQWLVLVPVVLAVLLTALMSAMFLSASGKAKDKQAQLSSLQEELAAIPTPDAAKVKTQSALAADKQARVTALSAALSRRVAWDRVFRELSLVLPDDVWLATISAKAPVPSSAATPPAPAAAGAAPAATQFTLDGFTYSHAAVARLLSRLAVVPDLVNVQLQQSTRTKVGVANAVPKLIVQRLLQPALNGEQPVHLECREDSTEALLALSCESRAEVDEMVRKAVSSGGAHAMDAQDHGFMYGWSFYDIDGHHWEVVWMDPSAIQS